MNRQPVVILHYTAPPIVGGVEAVLAAHARSLRALGHPVTIIAGRGAPNALPPDVDFIQIPEMDSQHPAIATLNATLDLGEIPPDFEFRVNQLAGRLSPHFNNHTTIIVHNIFSKHFNLALTAALIRLLDTGRVHRCLAWNHDFTWTSPTSRSKVYPRYPWNLLRTGRPDITYIVVSEQRRQELVELFNWPPEKIHVIYNGVDPQTLLGLSDPGYALIQRLGLLESNLNLLLPVRVTRAKNIELALQVTAALKTHEPHLRLILTGPPDPYDSQNMAYYTELLELRRRLKVEKEMRFVYESGPDPTQPFEVDAHIIGDLYRVSDLLFMPSFREGFGMPILEAGLIGMPIAASATIPAVHELSSEDIITFDPQTTPQELAAKLWNWLQDLPTYRLRRRVRLNYSWDILVQNRLKPLLEEPSS